jgi:hypothetical protein
MTDQPSLPFNADDPQPPPASHFASDVPPLPSGSDLVAMMCRAAWDAANDIAPIERSWDSRHRNSLGVPKRVGPYLAQLPTTSDEALRQVISTGKNSDGGEIIVGRNVVLATSWSQDAGVPPNTAGAPSIQRTQNYHFAGPTTCDSVVTTVSVTFDAAHSVDALNDFYERAALSPENLSGDVGVDLRDCSGLTVVQYREPAPEELMFLAQQRLHPNENWLRDAVRQPWPGFRSGAEDVVNNAGIVFDAPLRSIAS